VAISADIQQTNWTARGTFVLVHSQNAHMALFLNLNKHSYIPMGLCNIVMQSLFVWLMAKQFKTFTVQNGILFDWLQVIERSLK
jgi:hypothetical protein